jgi:hypothetical protein
MEDRKGWACVSRSGWLNWLRQNGFDDGVPRPTERDALFNLEGLAYLTINGEFPLSVFELDIWLLERTFMRVYQTPEFVERYGVLTVGDKYAWIAAQRSDLLPLKVRMILEDVSYVLDHCAQNMAAEAILAEWLAA